MAASVVWTDEAKDDLQELLNYIATENPRAAARYVEQIAQAGANLSDFPLKGRQYGHEFRAIVVRNHIVLYKTEDRPTRVLIAKVVHGKRDIGRMLAALSTADNAP